MEAVALLLWHAIHGIGMILLFFSFEDNFFPGHRCGGGVVLVEAFALLLWHTIHGIGMIFVVFLI